MIDETPGAYEDIDAVMAAQIELVDVVHTSKQVLCVKASRRRSEPWRIEGHDAGGSTRATV